MIGWKGEWGYFSGEISLSNMIVLSNLPLLIPQLNYIPDTVETDGNPTSIYNLINENYGNADTIYLSPGGSFTKGHNFPTLASAIPSIVNSKLLDGFPLSSYYFFRSESLNRIIVYNIGNDADICNIYDLELNKLFPRDFPGLNYIYGDRTERSSLGFYQYCVVGEFKQGNVYRYISAINSTGKTFYINKPVVLSQTNYDILFKDSQPPEPIGPNNPYEPGGPSGPGGGDGSFDNDSDQIIDSSLPTISSANTGFTRIYNPSLSQVQALARYLWTDENVIQTIWNHIKQYFEDPMQAIIGFNLVPVPVPNGGAQSFALMYIDTGVEMTVAASQFVDVDCGTFELKEYYGSALDYAPNTKVSCFLPFIGTVSLNTDEVMGRTLQVKYRVDICSGACVAKIAVDGNFIYQYSGHCAINIPISSADFSSYVSSAISVAQLAAGAIAAGAGGVMASTAVDATQQTNQVVTTTQITNTARNPSTGRQITTGTMTKVETRESPNDQSSTQASFSGITPQNISNTVGQIMSSKPNINHSGSFSGNSGYLGVRRPFLIIERPNMCMPSNFQALNGFPSMITLELSSCKGFTRVQQVQLTGFYATNPEQAEILQLLKSGVIL